MRLCVHAVLSIQAVCNCSIKYLCCAKVQSVVVKLCGGRYNIRYNIKLLKLKMKCGVVWLSVGAVGFIGAVCTYRLYMCRCSEVWTVNVL